MKAQSISINTIIVAAIALIVLVVSIVIFNNWTKIFSTGARDCKTQGGDCYSDCSYETIKLENANAKNGIYSSLPGTNCDDRTDNRKYCCSLTVPLGTD